MRKEDRRVRITKAAIRESLTELMSVHPLSKVSVKMICERADINRSTFYAHYQDQYDLLHKIQKEVIADIRAYLAGKTFADDSTVTLPLLTQVLEYVRDEAPLFKVLLNNNSGDLSFQSDLMQIAWDQIEKEVGFDSLITTQHAKYLQHFAISGFVSIIKVWLDDSTPESPEQLAGIISQLIFNGTSEFYR